MPVHEELPYSEATGNGVTTQFPLGFTCDHKIFLKVRLNDSYLNDDLWSLDKDTVTFKTAPETDSYIQFKRETKIERTIDYATYNDSLRGEILNNDFDTVYKILQETKADTSQYKPDYEYSVSKANEAFSCAQEAKTSAEEALQISNMTRTIEQGGTGASTAEKARENLNTYSIEDIDALIATGGEGSVVGIAGGGTGAITAGEARNNLDVPSTIEVATAIDDSLTPNATETIEGKAKIATTAIAQEGVNDTDFITALKLHNSVFGLSQTIVDVTSERSVGATYTNTTGKTIFISITTQGAEGTDNHRLFIDGVLFAYANNISGGDHVSLQAPIPIGSTYQLTISIGNMRTWVELR